jgi:hypothetical protein
MIDREQFGEAPLKAGERGGCIGRDVSDEWWKTTFEMMNRVIVS